jgi:hypothetical protein
MTGPLADLMTRHKPLALAIVRDFPEADEETPPIRSRAPATCRSCSSWSCARAKVATAMQEAGLAATGRAQLYGLAQAGLSGGGGG